MIVLANVFLLVDIRPVGLQRQCLRLLAGLLKWVHRDRTKEGALFIKQINHIYMYVLVINTYKAQSMDGAITGGHVAHMQAFPFHN